MGYLDEDEYEVSLWRDSDVRPWLDGRTFQAKVARTRYKCSVASKWPWCT